VPGDIFGLENRARYLFSAEAVIASEILVIDRAAMMSLAERETVLACDLWAYMANEVRRMQRHLLMLNRRGSERVAGFLLEMSDRMQLSDKIGLPMSRDDVADYLARRSETVSRILTDFENASAIALRTPRHIVVRDRARLEQMLV
jgi:CRP/FNR family transcriptional regulator, nitrogen fixation regulation protein